MTRLWPLVGSHYWAMDMFRFFTPKENIIRIWAWISLFPHVCNSEVMTLNPLPPLQGLTSPSTYWPFTLNTHTHMLTTHFYIYILKATLSIDTSAEWIQVLILSTLPSGLSLLQHLSDLTLGLIIGSGPSETRNNLFWSELSFHFP